MTSDHVPLTKPFAKYPHTRRAGNLIFLAGQGSRDPVTNDYAGLEWAEDGSSLKAYDISAQTQGVLRNIERALESEGLTADALIDVTVFLVDMADFEAMNRVWNDFFGGRVSPTRTTVAVRALPGHNFVEMKAVAYDPR